MKRKKMLLSAALLCGLCLAGCGDEEAPKNYKDGTYTAQSEQYVNEDESDTSGNGYGVVTLTVKDNKITECEFKTYELNGTLKDAEYGKENGEIANRDFYNKAQKAVGACDQYAKKLVEKGSLKGVDAISGATINYGEFKEAVAAALSQAEQ